MFRLCFDFKLEGGIDYNSGSILKIKIHRYIYIYIYIYMDVKKSAEVEEDETNSRNNVHIEYISAREWCST